jgi:hypothetical protein
MFSIHAPELLHVAPMKESALAPGFMSDFEGFWAAILRESPLWGTENC